jgi:hypothetical protein
MGLLQYPKLFCCCLFLFDPEAIICHWWLMESKWLKKHMYECKLICKWCSWSILIIFHSMLWIHKYMVAAMSTAVLLFIVPIWPIGHHLPLMRNQAKMTGQAPHVWAQVFFPVVTGLYWSYFMSWIHKYVVAAMATTVLLFRILIWPSGHHLPLGQELSQS